MITCVLTDDETEGVTGWEEAEGITEFAMKFEGLICWEEAKGSGVELPVDIVGDTDRVEVMMGTPSVLIMGLMSMLDASNVWWVVSVGNAESAQNEMLLKIFSLWTHYIVFSIQRLNLLVCQICSNAAV